MFDMIETPAQLLDSDKGIGEKRAILGQVFGDHRLFGFQTAVRLWLPLRPHIAQVHPHTVPPTLTPALCSLEKTRLL